MNNGFGSLPVRRGNKSIIVAAVITVASFLLLYIYQIYVVGKEDFGVTMFLSCISIVSMFLGELLRRICLLVEEVCHKQERHEGSWKRVFCKVLSVKNPYVGDIGIFILFLIIVSMAYHTYSENIWAISADGLHYLWLLMFLNIAIVPTFGYLVGIKSATEVEISDMKEKDNKNLADGLAWSYYFGYLKLVLPHIQKQVDKSNQELREKIYPLKLLILLPKDCYCYKSLSECDDRIQSHTNLPPLAINRAGVQKRQYHSTIYKISISKDDNQSVNMNQYAGEYYCLVEYATPLLSLYDMSKHPKAGFSEEERLEQVQIFVNKLTEILDDDPECKGKFQLIPLASTGCIGNDLAIVIVRSIKNCPVDVLPENILDPT